MKTNYLFIVLMMVLFTCGEDSVDKISDEAEVALQMNEKLVLPPGAFQVNPDDVEIDNSVTINSNGSGTVPISAGATMNNYISFNAPNGNVTAVGMRFGTSGPINFVPINTSGATAGTGSFSFQITPEICDNLSSICHDIKCYEFAQTDEGKISKSNIQEVAMLCGNCDEPSCAGLVSQADCSGDTGYATISSSLTGDLTASIFINCIYNPPTNQSDISTCFDEDDRWCASVRDVGESGNVTFNPDDPFDFENDPYFTLTNYGDTENASDDITYRLQSGTGSWNDGTFSYNVMVKSDENPTIYSVTGTFICPSDDN
ncbi:hypothetical protein [uncultured Algibacter sp.]|uniref:hypothetical protein n=1 Tax=uncultured Algibacter sp. TaxID=298659 RepID=UPI00261F769C|nr:hypothetical protein [uncultured Algibacter sp.]